MSSNDRRPSGSRTKRRGIHPLFHLAIALTLIAILQGFVIKPFSIPSESMEPTLKTGDAILVNRLAYLGSAPAAGDVIVFEGDSTWGSFHADDDPAWKYAAKWVGGLFGIGPGVHHYLAKRIIAVGGQTISCCDASGNILVGGESAPPSPGTDFAFNPATLTCDTEIMSLRCFDEAVVPPGHVVVAGDNRVNSADSLTMCRGPSPEDSCLLTVPVTDIVGTIAFRWAPIDEFGTI